MKNLSTLWIICMLFLLIFGSLNAQKYEPEWTESIAVGSECFTEKIKKTITSQSRTIKILPDGQSILS